MSRIDPRVRDLARELGQPRCAHLTPAHQRDYLHGLALMIQTSIDQYFAGLPPDDRTWPEMGRVEKLATAVQQAAADEYAAVVPPASADEDAALTEGDV